MNNKLTPIALCADDYAQNAGINEGILDLLDKKRLTAVSCFSTAPDWKQAAPALLPYATQTDIGLHFNLTEGFGQEKMPGLRSVILRSLLRGMQAKEIRKKLEDQLDAFEDAIGHAPDFIDGHQHVHQLPGVRQVLIKVLQRRYADKPIWVRNTVPADLTWKGKPQILKLLGGQVTADHLYYESIPTNDGFGGVYGFDRADYDACFRDWLKAARPGMLIMCHPATAPYPHDDIAKQRVIEHAFLQSFDCVRALDQAHVQLAKLSDCFLLQEQKQAASA